MRDSEDVITALKANRMEKKLANRIIRAIKMHVRSQEQWQKGGLMAEREAETWADPSMKSGHCSCRERLEKWIRR
jgi:hypothetical protein